ncbi:MAG TPA: protein kinase [Thermoanaerobaculia bacterium]|nr:protein kinase [Thermoanaerobaculia bacterium]
MTLATGTRLGPYEILAPIGAGGMGEVYRAKDPRLGREVAIKVLPATFSQDADRLHRFEQEARAAGILNHPNITAVHDIGSANGSPYIVAELLEGETLRARLLAGSIPVRKAIDWAIQIAKGLAAAHEKGIVHRDLKPENLFVTRDGRVKILDFGLAKLKSEKDESGQTDMPTVSGGTQPGVVLGTMGYMAPEQVRGKAADQRSDIFAFGTILYEMLSGQRAFRGESAADTITAILTKEPPDLAPTNKEIHGGLDRLVRHCLEKNPEERFQSARDIAFDLESLSGVSAATAAVAAPGPARKRGALVPALLAALVALAAGLFAGFGAGKKAGYTPPPNYQQLTFRRGELYAGRFAPDGQTVLYAAAWDGKPVEIFSTRTDRPESRVFGLVGADVASISKSGEMLVITDRHIVEAFLRSGTLAQVSVSGGVAPRPILTDVEWADWGPDGTSYAVVREVNGRKQLEYPAGKVLFQSSGWISHPRVSPKGDVVAFLDHPVRRDDGGSVLVVDRSAKARLLAGTFRSVQGLAWDPGGKEVWFTGTRVGGNRAIHSVSLGGSERLLARVTESLTIQDIAADGRVLVSHDVIRIGVLGRGAGETRERDLSWLDWSAAFDLTRDGKSLLFAETGEGSGPAYSCFLRGTDGSAPVRLGDGVCIGISPDGRWVTANTARDEHPRLWLYPTGAGEKKQLPTGDLGVESSADWTHDGSAIVFTATEPGHGSRVFTIPVAGGQARALSPEGYRLAGRSISPDGKSIIVIGPDRKRYLYPLQGGEPQPVTGLEPDETPSGWSADGRFLYAFRRRDIPARVFRIEVATGKRELWKELMPSDGAGVQDISPIIPTPDGQAYVYGYSRNLSDMYVVEGLK